MYLESLPFFDPLTKQLFITKHQTFRPYMTIKVIQSYFALYMGFIVLL